MYVFRRAVIKRLYPCWSWGSVMSTYLFSGTPRRGSRCHCPEVLEAKLTRRKLKWNNLAESVYLVTTNNLKLSSEIWNVEQDLLFYLLTLNFASNIIMTYRQLVFFLCLEMHDCLRQTVWGFFVCFKWEKHFSLSWMHVQEASLYWNTQCTCNRDHELYLLPLMTDALVS